MNSCRLRGPEHKLHGHTDALRDIMDALSADQYRILVETDREGLGVFDGDDRFLYANNMLREYLGASMAELAQHSASDYLDSTNRNAWKQHRRLGKTGAEARFELVWARKDGSTVNTFVSSQGIFDRDGLYRGTLAVVDPPGDSGKSGGQDSPLLQPERDLFRKILNAQEMERRKISRELHDEIGQALTVLKLDLGLMSRNLPEALPQLGQDCRDLISCIDGVIDHVRRLARELSPAVLEDVGLSAALRALLQEFARDTGIKVRAVVGELDGFLPKEEEIIVYRVVQEALKNVRTHAKAHIVTVVGEADGPLLSFVIEDDGMGFSVDQFSMDSSARGLGLGLIGERVRVLGGTFDLESGIGKGTRIRFVIPIHGESGDDKAIRDRAGRRS